MAPLSLKQSRARAHLDDTIKLIGETLASASPPFDGIMGFSQGGSMAAMTIAMQQAGDSRLAKAPKLKFAWIQSSRIPRDPSCLPLFEKGPITLPCFFSVIEDDKSVLAEESRALISKFSDVTLVSVAKGGHGPSPSPKKPDQKENANKLRKWLHQRKDAIAKRAARAAARAKGPVVYREPVYDEGRVRKVCAWRDTIARGGGLSGSRTRVETVFYSKITPPHSIIPYRVAR